MPGDLHLPEHENTKIKILYTGDQPADVTLTHNGHPVKESPHIKYTVFDDYLLIFIKDISKDDMGKSIPGSLKVRSDPQYLGFSFLLVWKHISVLI